MAYPPAIAAALSGPTLRQLACGRSRHTTEPLIGREFHKSRSRVSYSFRDVLALRTFGYLRSRGAALQRVRRAVERLRKMGRTEHLSRYRLVAVCRDVGWQVSDEEAVDLTGRPDQQVIAEMVDILEEFANVQQRSVVPLCEPAPGLQVDPVAALARRGTRLIMSSESGGKAKRTASFCLTFRPCLDHGRLAGPDDKSTRLVQLGCSSRKARVAAAKSGELNML